MILGKQRNVNVSSSIVSETYSFDRSDDLYADYSKLQTLSYNN